MKKILLLIAVALFSTATYAQKVLWNDSIVAASENDMVVLNSPATMDKDGNLYVTGSKTMSFEFAGEELSEDAGVYIAKYDATGKQIYAIELLGSIAITAITTDADSIFYVAGSFAGGAFIMGVDGLDGKYETISNSEKDTRTATFIAKYDANGNLLAVKSYEATTPHPDAWDLTSAYISKIVVENSKVYAQIGYTGNILLDDDLSLTASYIYLDLGGWGYVQLINNAAVLSFDADLESVAEVAKLGVAEDCGSSSSISSFNFAVDGDDVYVAAYAMGDLVLTTSAGSEAFKFEYDGEGTAERGVILSKVGAKTVKCSNIPNSAQANFNYINGMEVINGDLIIAGTFNTTCAFDTTKVAVGASDVFVASVDAEEFSVNWVYTNANDEGATNMYYEAVKGVAFTDDNIFVVDAGIHMQNIEAPVAKNYAVSYAGVAEETEAIAATAVAYNANNVAYINYTDATYITVYGDETAGIESVVVETENNAIYDLTGRRVENAIKGIYIIGGKKVLVK